VRKKQGPHHTMEHVVINAVECLRVSQSLLTAGICICYL